MPSAHIFFFWLTWLTQWCDSFWRSVPLWFHCSGILCHSWRVSSTVLQNTRAQRDYHTAWVWVKVCHGSSSDMNFTCVLQEELSKLWFLNSNKYLVSLSLSVFGEQCRTCGHFHIQSLSFIVTSNQRVFGGFFCFFCFYDQRMECSSFCHLASVQLSVCFIYRRPDWRQMTM